jgi:predicted alpha/beta hydrolase family esterase
MTPLVRALEYGAFLAWLALSIGVLLYACVSFYYARRHFPPRPFVSAFFALLREIVLAFIVTPILLLYVVRGHRMVVGNGTPIVLVHGYTQNRGTFLGIARALRRAGLGPVYGFNYWSFQDVRKSSVRLARFIQKVRKETGARAVDVVAHSMGGLVAVECMRAVPKRVRRLVTIASPHSGVLWRGPILGIGGAQLRRGSALITKHAARVFGVHVLSIASKHDNIVFPAEQSAISQRGGRDIVVEGPGHLTILFDPRVASEITSFLSAP